MASREIPPVVYVPISGEESEGRAQIELRRLPTEQLAITAFSALDRLQSELGSAQRWLLVRIADLERQAANRDVSRVLLDPRLSRSAVGPVPQSTDDPSWEDWREHQRLERDYGRMQRDVVDWHADLEIWVSENLISLASGPSDAVSAEEIHARLREGAHTLLDGGATYLGIDWTSRVDRLNIDARTYRDLASEMVRKSGVTRDPALKALLQEKPAAGLPDTFDAKASDFDSFSDFLTSGRRVLEVAGPAGDVAFGVWDIAEGEAPLDVAVEWAGGALGGAVGGEVAAMLAFPAVASVGLGVGGAALVGWVASEVWGTVAPSWKEGIYEFVADGFIGAGDMGESVGDWFYDVSQTLSHSG